jgi:serine protease Do
LTPQIAARYRISSEIKHGVVVISVETGSPADDIGLQEGDVILEINRKKIETIKDFEKAIKEINIEKGIVFRLHRRGNSFYHSFKRQP